MMKRTFAAALLMLGTGALAQAHGPTPVDVARTILEEHQEAVIWIDAVVKIQMSSGGAQLGPAQEFKVETIGTLISADGLAVSSYSMMDPMGNMPDYSFSSNGEERTFQAQTVFSEVKYRLPDGAEIPAKMVMKDPELDLACFVPQLPEGAPPPEFHHLDLTSSPEARVADDLITLGRLGRSLNRQPTVSLSRIAAVVTKPRKVFVDDRTMGALGTPVFTMGGEVLGITVLRRAPRADVAGVMAYGNVSMVVIPSEDVMEIGRQALEKAGTPTGGGAKGGDPGADAPAED